MYDYFSVQPYHVMFFWHQSEARTAATVWNWSGKTLGAFHLGKNPEISVGAKVEFPTGKKLFHLVVNPGTSLCPTVDLELVQTTRNVNGTRDSV